MTQSLGLACSVQDIRQWPASDVLVLTVNNRLARGVRSELAAALTGQTIELPRIEPWSSFLTTTAFERSFEHAVASPRVIDVGSSRLLWAEVIEHIEAKRSLVDIEQLASLAQDADRLMLEWHIQVQRAWYTPDHERFLSWRQAYEQRLAAWGAVDLARLTAALTQWIEQGQVRLPRRVVMAGYTDYSPAMSAVLAELKKARVELFELSEAQPELQAKVRQLVCASNADQWQAAGRWAQTQLKQFPQGRFAIVAPSLQSEAALAKRVLGRLLKPEEGGWRFNVAVAPPLSDWPEARAMMAWLSLCIGLFDRAEVPTALAGQALLAGCCAGSISEAGARALVDAQWRERYALKVTAKRWAQGLDRLPLLRQAWAGTQEIWQQTPSGDQSWLVWANVFRQLLVSLGFPGEGSQSSTQYQTTTALDALVSRLATLDDLLAPTTIQGALKQLRRLAGQTLFQPQRARDARLDVLGLLEAEAGHWDAVWIMGLTDTVLPSVASPNPLIPMNALMRANAPRSTPAREYQWAEQLYKALLKTANDVTISWPLRDGEQTLRASPFVCNVPQEIAPETLEDGPDRLLQHPWSDERAWPIAPDETIRGGVAVIETQARNPLWAFFRYRLAVQGMPAYAWAPTNIDRGLFVHKVLQSIWMQLRDHEQLLKHAAQADWAQWVMAQVASHGDIVLRDWPRALRELEQQRTGEIVLAWFELEQAREPFTVLGTETSHTLSMGALDLHVVIDRIDALADGRQWLIDYKTGRHVPQPQKDWKGPGYRNLQLLAYAQVLKQQGTTPDALLWGKLHKSGVTLSGLSQSLTPWPDIEPWSVQSWGNADWAAQLEDLHQAMHRLAQSFAEGRNDNVTWHHDDLKYCTIGPLLRLNEDAEDE